MKNLKQFNELIERYETIQIDEINSIWLFHSKRSALHLTGFGSCGTCTLCQAVYDDLNEEPDCTECVWRITFGCWLYEKGKTYDAIKKCETPAELLQAYRNRAKAMRKFLNNKLKEDATK